MPEQNGLTPQEDQSQQELELALGSLSPVVGRVDPVSAAFLAGRRSVRRQVVGWQSAAAILLIAGGLSWVLPVKSPVVHRAESVQAVALITPEAAPAQPLSDQSLLMLQNAVRDKGLDGLPTSNVPELQVVRAGDIF
jgi:hypothetical protein